MVPYPGWGEAPQLFGLQFDDAKGMRVATRVALKLVARGIIRLLGVTMRAERRAPHYWSRAD